MIRGAIMRHQRGAERGQGMIEFAMVLPLIAMLLLGAIEFGSAYNHHLTLEYATREGARSGGALANGGGPLGCGGGQSPNAATVDPQIIAAVERVLTAAGSPIVLTDIQRIEIYHADPNGSVISGQTNVWLYGPGGPPVDGKVLDFYQSSVAWNACQRQNSNPADSIGVSLTYRYQAVTALGNFVAIGTITMKDRAVMPVSPTS